MGEPQATGAIEISYCVVNTSQRDLLVRGLDAVGRERAGLPFATEVLVLDNGSRDGSAAAAREHPAVDETIALGQRRGKGANDSELLRRAGGRFCLLLNEDSELLPGSTLALWEALRDRPHAACAGARLLRPDGSPQPSAWRFPGPGTALAGALFLHRLLTVQSRGERVRAVDWCQSAALLVRREAAAQVGYLDPDSFLGGRMRLDRDLALRALAARSTTSSSRPPPSRSGGSSNWRATATSTCASTIRAPPRRPSAG